MTTPSTTNSVLRAGIVVLTLGTAAIHLQLNFPDPVFILNGLGYLALLAALYVPLLPLARYANVVRWVLAGYAAITILLWVLIGARNGLAYADKAIEVTLITLLLIEARRPSS
jgi:hypothetical protein